MMNNKLFLIVKKTRKTKKPIQAFIEKDFDKAKLYFQGFIYKDPCILDYELRWIGKFIDGILKINDVFIQAGWQAIANNKYEKETIQQIKLKYDFYMNPYHKYTDKLKNFFEGEEIK